MMKVLVTGTLAAALGESLIPAANSIKRLIATVPAKTTPAIMNANMAKLLFCLLQFAQIGLRHLLRSASIGQLVIQFTDTTLRPRQVFPSNLQQVFLFFGGEHLGPAYETDTRAHD